MIFDQRSRPLPAIDPAMFKQLCHRKLGVGGDGILLVEKGYLADYSMRIFNSDGSEAEMCGNGMRCMAHFLAEKEGRKTFSIECFGKSYGIQVDEGLVFVEMPAPRILKPVIQIDYAGETLEMTWIDTGVPHLVLFVEEISKFPLENLGPYLRYHAQFAPSGTNVNIAQVLKKGVLTVRTYERGVEDETLACGTGCAAVAACAKMRFSLSSPIEIFTKSGECLSFNFRNTPSGIQNILMSGPATKVFCGQIEI